jgi:hypothetical protein
MMGLLVRQQAQHEPLQPSVPVLRGFVRRAFAVLFRWHH